MFTINKRQSEANPQSFNRYSYVQNDPVNFVDPTGLDDNIVLPPEHITVIGIIGGIFSGPGGSGGVVGPPGPLLVDVGPGDHLLGPLNPPTTEPQDPLPPPNSCEQLLGAMFGGPGAIMRTTYDVDGNYRGRDDLAALGGTARYNRSTLDYDSIWDSEHLNNSPHLLGNLAGTATTDIYVPGNYQGRPTAPSPTAGVVLVNYAQFGSLTNVTLAIFHVGNFGVRQDGDRVRIGSTGGPGGGQGGTRNLHAHFEIWRGKHTSVLGTAQRYAARIPFDLAGLCP